MEKKLRITIPKEIYTLIESDLKDFGITKNFLCNYIFKYSDGFKEIYNYKYSGSKRIIQFNLNKSNRENYYYFLAEKKIQVEAEYFRNIFIHYAQQSKKSRERFIFKSIIEKIRYAIENKRKVIVTFADGTKKKISVYNIASSELELKNYVFSYDEETQMFRNFTLRNIRSIYITNEKYYDEEMDFVEEMIENFDPFLSHNKRVVVRFSKEGIKMFEMLKTYRPQLIDNNEMIYKFRCSNLQAKRYFSCFWNEVEILEPKELRQWFKDKATKVFENYR